MRIPTHRLTGPVISLALAGIIIAIWQAGLLERAELAAFDARLRLNPAGRVSEELAVVGITRECEKVLGEDISRGHHAQTIARLSEAGAAAIAYDIFFPLYRDTEEDRTLVAAVQSSGRVILPVFCPDNISPQPVHPQKEVYPVATLRGSFPQLEAAAAGLGHINVVTDRDQVVRALPVAITHQGRYYPRLALAAVRKRGFSPDPPLDRYGRYYINYPAPAALVQPGIFHPFHRVLNRDFPAGAFDGRIVLVGQTIHGLKHADLVPTPFGYQFGVLAEAASLNTLLTGNFLRRLPPGPTTGLLAVVALILGFSIYGRRNLLNLALAGIILAAIIASAHLLFRYQGLVLETVPLFLLTVSSAGASLAYSLQHAIRERRQTLDLLGREGSRVAALIQPFLFQDSASPRAGEALFTITRETPDMVMRILAESFGAERAGLFFRRPEEASFNLAAACNFPATFQSRLTEILRRAADTNKPVLTAIAETGGPGGRSRETGLMAVPVIARETFHSVIVMMEKRPTPLSPSARFNRQDIQMATVMCLQTLVGIQNAYLGNALKDAQVETIFRLARAVEYRDRETGEHINRIAEYAVMLARAAGLPDFEVELLRFAMPLHDIGKISIPDHILLKEGPLTPQERKVIETHPTLGARMLSGSRSVILQTAEIITLYHHERYDGTGYPAGLAGRDIHIYGRIAALVDVFDAICSQRCYKKALPKEDALRIIREGSGTAFDPELVKLFLNHLPPD